MKCVYRLLFIVALLTLSAATFAQDGVPTPNDPAVNPDANACFEGGSMAGRCGVVDSNGNGVVDDFERNFDFECGWFLIRFESGELDREGFPGRCISVLPQEMADEMLAACEMPLTDDRFVLDLPVGEFALVGSLIDNDCGVVPPAFPQTPAIRVESVLAFSFETAFPNRIFLLCDSPGPYFVEQPYEDAVGNRAIFIVEGNCVDPAT